MNTPSSLQRFISRFSLVAGLGAGMAFVVPASVSAQTEGATAQRAERGERGHGHARGHRGHRGHGAMLRALNLSENQQAQIRAIHESARDQARELREAGRTDQTRARMRAIRQESRRLTMEVLTPAQKTQLEQLREQRGAQRIERRVTHMTEKLSLSPAQASRVRSILEAAKTQRQALRNGSAAGDERRQAMRGLHDRTRAAIDAVLTPAQRTQAAEHRAARGERRHRGERGDRGNR
jgi:Spy/CpxP family protein refolding chaperone